MGRVCLSSVNSFYKAAKFGLFSPIGSKETRKGFNIKNVVLLGKKESLINRISLITNNNQLEAIVLQDITNYTTGKKKSTNYFTKIILI